MKLSIITINYNNKDGLQRTIDSILSQTWKDWEWLIVDGGSTDGSKELIEKYQEYLTYWCSEKDGGIYNAQNKGTSLAKGEYLSYLNSGDTYCSPDTLQQVFANHLTEDIVYGNWNIVSEGECKHIQSSPRAMTLHKLIDYNICHQAMFIRRDFKSMYAYDESYKVLADWKCWLQGVLANCTYRYIPVTVCDFDGVGVSNASNPRCMEDYQKLCEEFSSIRKLNDELKKYSEDNIILDIYDLMHHNVFCLNIIHLVSRILQLLMGIKPRC